MDGTIMVIDPSIHEREKVGRLIGNIGSFEVINISCPEQYLSQIGRLDNLSLIIIDISLPTENEGFNLLSFIRKDPVTLGIPVVITTRLDKPEYKSAALRFAVSDYILKPYQLKRLEKSIRSFVKIQEKPGCYMGSMANLTFTCEDYISREIKMASRINLPLSLIVITSIISMPEDNEEQAEASGAIASLYESAAEKIRRILRGTDTVTLNGEHDILIILPATSDADARLVMEKIRQCIRGEFNDMPFRHESLFHPVSVTFPEDGKDFHMLMESASKKIQSKEMLEKSSFIPATTRKYANRRYNQFNRWF